MASQLNREQAAGHVDEVVAACQLGDRDAQRQIYDSCHQSVYRLMVRMAGLQEAADLTQQVFLQAFRRIGQFKGGAKFETWLYRVATNEALQHLRRRGRANQQRLQSEPADRSAGQQRRLETKEMLEEALARLDAELRALFLLREVEQLSYREIAQTLEIPEGTVASRLNRARQELQEHLEHLGWEA